MPGALQTCGHQPRNDIAPDNPDAPFPWAPGAKFTAGYRFDAQQRFAVEGSAFLPARCSAGFWKLNESGGGGQELGSPPSRGTGRGEAGIFYLARRSAHDPPHRSLERLDLALREPSGWCYPRSMNARIAWFTKAGCERIG
jgi:hypothetical protein